MPCKSSKAYWTHSRLGLLTDKEPRVSGDAGAVKSVPSARVAPTRSSTWFEKPSHRPTPWRHEAAQR